MTPDKRAFEALLDQLESESYANREGIGLRSDYEEARAAVLAAYEEAAGREGRPVSSIDYWQKRGHHVCPECNGTRVRSYRQADHLGGQYVDVPCGCAHPAPKAVKLPERKEYSEDDTAQGVRYKDGWNACLDALAASPARGGHCQWTYDDDGFWNQECGGAWSFTEGGPDENNCRFCPSCGKTIDAVMSREAQ